MYPIISSDPLIQAKYNQLRDAGESHNIAEILAARAFPSLRTDATFNAGRCNGNQFETMPGVGDAYREVAERHGVNTTGKTYMPQLAEFFGDPRAWVSDRGDVLKVAKERGYRVEGAVDYEPSDFRQQDPVNIDKPHVAPDILEREVQKLTDSDPSLTAEEAADRIYPSLTGQVDLNPVHVPDYDESAFYGDE